MMSPHYLCECGLDRKECDFVILEAFLKAIAGAGWIPILGDTPIGRGGTQSLNSLIKCLQSIKFLHYYRHEPVYPPSEPIGIKNWQPLSKLFRGATQTCTLHTLGRFLQRAPLTLWSQVISKAIYSSVLLWNHNLTNL